MPKPQHVCNKCGATYGRWLGECSSCGSWNTISDTPISHIKGGSSPSAALAGSNAALPIAKLAEGAEQIAPIPTGIAEFDRVLGGGIIAGSVLLISGDPGIGKSTLTLQACASISASEEVLYVAAEEVAQQVALRAKRLGLGSANAGLISETKLGTILATLDSVPNLGLAVIDSIQSIGDTNLDSIPGSPTQIRHCTQMLTEFAKRKNCALILVGHVTKDGQISGPRLLEHAVDVVLQFEGQQQYTMRVLRALKNRFGTVDELGVFTMSETGLVNVSNPSTLLLEHGDVRAPGSSVAVILEGKRGVLVEVQALISAPVAGNPRRNVVGWDTSRCAMLLAVLDAHCGTDLASRDVYVAISGGFRITEPAADLAIAAALWSSLHSKPLPPKLALFGEVSLSGAIRNVSGFDVRAQEARRAGFTDLLTPEDRDSAKADKQKGKKRDNQDNAVMQSKSFSHLPDLVRHLSSLQ